MSSSIKPKKTNTRYKQSNSIINRRPLQSLSYTELIARLHENYPPKESKEANIIKKILTFFRQFWQTINAKKASLLSQKKIRTAHQTMKFQNQEALNEMAREVKSPLVRAIKFNHKLVFDEIIYRIKSGAIPPDVLGDDRRWGILHAAEMSKSLQSDQKYSHYLNTLCKIVSDKFLIDVYVNNALGGQRGWYAKEDFEDKPNISASRTLKKILEKRIDRSTLKRVHQKAKKYYGESVIQKAHSRS